MTVYYGEPLLRFMLSPILSLPVTRRRAQPGRESKGKKGGLLGPNAAGPRSRSRYRVGIGNSLKAAASIPSERGPRSNVTPRRYLPRRAHPSPAPGPAPSTGRTPA